MGPADEGDLQRPATQEPASSGGVIASPWGALRRLTDARVALGRAGHSLPTAAHLALQADHAQARDAVHRPFDAAALAAQLQAQAPLAALQRPADAGRPPLRLHSAARDRREYLQRPDLGRQLDEASRALLRAETSADTAAGLTDVAADAPSTDPWARPHLVVVLADGLSALAAQRQAGPLLAALGASLAADPQPWHLGPLVLVEQARVAVGDEIGQALGAALVLVLIGERPGLSSPDSLGAYLTYAPRPGRTDAERNCVSNIRPAGLVPDRAAATLHWLLAAARQRGLTGVGLKDESPGPGQALASACVPGLAGVRDPG